MGRSRSRSKSPREKKERDRSRERRHRKDKKRRHRDDSSDLSESDTMKLGGILKEKKRQRERSRSKEKERRKNDSPGLSRDVQKELTGSFDSSNLSETARKWLEERIAEQVTSRVDKLEAVMAERVAKTRQDIESRLRAQIESEMQEEVNASRKREEDSRARCQTLEQELKKKIAEAEESEKKYNEERLAMLAQRSQLERERQEVRKEREEMQKNEQHAILNKGGASRPPIKLKFGFNK